MIQSFKKYRSKVIKNSEYEKNVDHMKSLIENLNKKLKNSIYEGDEKIKEKIHKEGRLLARERVELLLDEDSPFLELMPLAGDGEKGVQTGASCICGIGLVNSIECGIISNVPSIKGGAYNEYSVRKTLRFNKIVEENRLPVINLVETAGADLTQQSRVFHIGGSVFYDLTKRSKLGIPTISIVFGSSTAGGAYSPGLSDYVIMVKNQAKVYLAGPPLLKMATGEITTHEELGGAEMHTKMTGVSDYLAEDEYDAISIAREIVSTLNFKKKTDLPEEYFTDVKPPMYNKEELLGIIPSDLKTPFDSREIIARIVDGSRFHEFKPSYGTTMVTCWAKIHGFLVGIIANNGVIFSETANKTTQFIQICEKRSVPLLFLHNVTGFMVGKKYEQGGIIKHGSKLINAVSNRTVPAISIIIGASYGAGNYAMCGRAYGPRFLFSWPNAKIAVMGTEQLVGVMSMVHNRSKSKDNPDSLKPIIENLKNKQEKESSAWYCSSQIIDDGIIDPRDTRDVLGICLSVIYNSDITDENSGIYGINRM